MGVSVQSKISHSLHKAGLCGRVARKKPLLNETHLKTRMEFEKKHLMMLQACGGMFCGQTSQKLNVLVSIKSVTSGTSRTAHHPVKHGEGQQHVMGLLFISRDWQARQTRRDNEWCNVQENP